MLFITTNSTPRGTVHIQKLVVAQLVKSPQSISEPEGSIPCSQQPTTYPYPEPDESSPHPFTL
jgi:hypothetical protein